MQTNCTQLTQANIQWLEGVHPILLDWRRMLLFEGATTMLIASRHLRDALQAKGYTVQLQEINGGRDFFNWQAALPDGLMALLKTKGGEMK